MLSNACQYFQKPDFEEMFPVFGHNILSLQVTSHVDRYDTGLLQGDHGVKYSVKSTATFTLHGKFSERVIRVYIYTQLHKKPLSLLSPNLLCPFLKIANNNYYYYK